MSTPSTPGHSGGPGFAQEAEQPGPNGESGPGPLPYERAQRRLRVDGPKFGKVVTRHREAEGWSQRELSRLSGVPLTTIANLERGDTAVPDPEVTCGLALTFGYSSPGAMLSRGGTRREGGPGGTRPAPTSPSLEATFAAVLRAAMGVLDERKVQTALAPAALAAALAGGAVGLPATEPAA